jgi:hypothetical protein
LRFSVVRVRSGWVSVIAALCDIFPGVSTGETYRPRLTSAEAVGRI